MIARHAASCACGAATTGIVTGCGGAWRVAAMASITPTAPIASTNAAISAARGGPPASALPLNLSITLTLPKSAQKNLPEVMWAAAMLIPYSANSASLA
jgi:hypothetical protein